MSPTTRTKSEYNIQVKFTEFVFTNWLQTGYKPDTDRLYLPPVQVLQLNPLNNSLPRTVCGLDSSHPRLPAAQAHVQIDIGMI